MKGKCMKKEKFEKLKTKEDFKEILWRLCYAPEDALKELELEGYDSKEVKKAILQYAKEKDPQFLFAGETPCVDTLGIDLCIKDPVIRDILIEKCSEAQMLDVNVPKVISLLKWEYNESDDEEKKNRAYTKLIGGLLELKFTDEEANYIFKTCNLYPVSLFLKTLNEKNRQARTFARKAYQSDGGNKVEKQTTPGNQLINFLNNKELIKEVYEIAGSFTTEQEIMDALEKENEPIRKLQKLQKQIAEVTELVTLDVDDKIQEAIDKLKEPVEKLEILQSKITHLSKKGIYFDEIIQKKEAILSIFEAAAQL